MDETRLGNLTAKRFQETPNRFSENKEQDKVRKNHKVQNPIIHVGTERALI